MHPLSWEFNFKTLYDYLHDAFLSVNRSMCYHGQGDEWCLDNRYQFRLSLIHPINQPLLTTTCWKHCPQDNLNSISTRKSCQVNSAMFFSRNFSSSPTRSCFSITRHLIQNLEGMRSEFRLFPMALKFGKHLSSTVAKPHAKIRSNTLNHGSTSLGKTSNQILHCMALNASFIEWNTNWLLWHCKHKCLQISWYQLAFLCFINSPDKMRSFSYRTRVIFKIMPAEWAKCNSKNKFRLT